MLSPSSPVVFVAAVAGLTALAVLVAGHSHWTVPATGPWAVAGGAIAVAGRAGAYGSLRPAPSERALVAVVAVLGVAAWVWTGRLAAGRRGPSRERYLAAAGGGLAAVVTVALLARFQVAPIRLAWVLVVPFAAAVLAAVAFVAAGFALPDLLSELRLGGLYAVGAVVFEGTASAVAVGVFGTNAGVVVTPAVRRGLAAAAVAPTWWAVVSGHLVVGLAVVAVLGRLSRWRTALGVAGVFVVAVLAVWSGTVTLLWGAIS